VKILATYNIKGGVGKTATAVNLGYLAARDGYRVLLWDLDPQGAASFLFRIKPRVKGGGKALIRGTKALDAAIKGTDYDGLDLLPADFTYRNLDLLLDAAPSSALVADIVYAPLETPLLTTARRQGLTIVDGLGMLMHQARPAFCDWFGVMPEVTPALRSLVAATL